MLGGHVVAVAVVFQIVAQGGDEVVRAVAAEGATETQLLAEVVLLDVTLHG